MDGEGELSISREVKTICDSTQQGENTLLNVVYVLVHCKALDSGTSVWCHSSVQNQQHKRQKRITQSTIKQRDARILLSLHSKTTT